MTTGTWTPFFVYETYPERMVVVDGASVGGWQWEDYWVRAWANIKGTITYPDPQSLPKNHLMVGGLPFAIAPGPVGPYTVAGCINHGNEIIYPAGSTFLLATPYPNNTTTVAITSRGSQFKKMISVSNIPDGSYQEFRFEVGYKTTEAP